MSEQHQLENTSPDAHIRRLIEEGFDVQTGQHATRSPGYYAQLRWVNLYDEGGAAPQAVEMETVIYNQESVEAALSRAEAFTKADPLYCPKVGT